MNPLDRFEQFVEGIMEGGFSRLFGGRLQPVEIAKRMARAMESQQQVGVGGKLYVPNNYKVMLNPNDYARYEPARTSLERELATYLIGTAREQGFVFLSTPKVTLTSLKNVGPNQVRVEANYTDQEPAPARHQAPPRPVQPAPPNAAPTERIDESARISQPVRTQGGGGLPQALKLDDTSSPMNGDRFPIDASRPVVRVGRALDNDIVIEDRRVSRHHAELIRQGNSLLLRDLKSTNGTAVNGQPVQETKLVSGDRISLGGLELAVE